MICRGTGCRCTFQKRLPWQKWNKALPSKGEDCEYVQAAPSFVQDLITKPFACIMVGYTGNGCKTLAMPIMVLIDFWTLIWHVFVFNSSISVLKFDSPFLSVPPLPKHLWSLVTCRSFSSQYHCESSPTIPSLSFLNAQPSTGALMRTVEKLSNYGEYISYTFFIDLSSHH